MKLLSFLLILIIPYNIYAQFGVKAGLNFANVSKVESISNSSRSGFHVGVFLAPYSKKILSSRTELIFSRQGYNYKSSTNSGNVNLDYIMLPQLMGINITKYVQIQLGGQIAFLVNASVDSSSGTSSGSGASIMNLYNKFDYGYGGGLEIHPLKGLLIGARVNISLGNLYKDILSGQPGTMPSFIPKVDVKNNLFQIFIGWTFGNSKSNEKQKSN
jgi:hypothetical protein